jgi:Uma2 family endonuclease
MPRSEPGLRRWTLKEYYRLGELGFFDGQRVELINGKIIQMAPIKNFHVAATDLTAEALRAAFGAGYWVRTQAPLDLTPTSSPEPDVAVVRGSPRGSGSANPTTASLVVEVSDSTLHADRGRKARLYARAAVGEYWIVNLVDRQLEVFRDPKPDPTHPGRAAYGQLLTLAPTDTVTPRAAPGAKIKVADLLP